jgi:hypothetical protein
MLFTDYSCDVVAVCEVSTRDINTISSNLGLTNISVLDLTDAVGKTRFDIAVFFNYEKLHLRTSKTLYKTQSNNVIKAAQVVEATSLFDGKKLHIYLCHWASRLNSEGSLKRIASAKMVYDSAFDIMDNNGDVIVMGDFNDNPYDESVLSHLNATRCHDSVRAFPKERFYNPFWRSIVSKDKYDHLAIDTVFRSGTMKYKQPLGTIWHSYDQIMVSGSFLGSGYWHLNENNTDIVEAEVFLDAFENKASSTRHLPIICEITNPQGE